MKDNKTFAENKECMYIFKYFKNSDYDSYELIQNAVQLLYAKCSADIFFSRIKSAYIAVKYISADLNDVIALLFAYPKRIDIINRDDIFQLFGASSKYYFELINKTSNNALKNPHWKEQANAQNPKFNWTVETYLDFFIMEGICDKKHTVMVEKLHNNGVVDTASVTRAYNFAKKAHQFIHRKTGEPYVNHVLSVAAHLAELVIDTDIIIGALLHDVQEDTNFSNADIIDRHGKRVATYVEIVTSVDKEFENSFDITKYKTRKHERDELTFEKIEKMINESANNVFALYIKGADRYHNLITMDGMDQNVIIHKIEETESLYLPLFRKYNLNYFVKIIEDAIWKLIYRQMDIDIENAYGRIVHYNSEHIAEFETLLSTTLNHELNSVCEQNFTSKYLCEISRLGYTSHDVYKFVKGEYTQAKQLKNIINKASVPISQFDVIIDATNEDGNIKLFMQNFIERFTNKIAVTDRAIISIKYPGFNSIVIDVADKYRNIIRIKFMMRNDYNISRFGRSQGLNNGDDIFEDDIAIEDKITVYLRNGDSKILPKGSRVIDLAFSIHEEIGLTTKSAIINGNPVNVYTVLHDQNKVIIEADTKRENGVQIEFIPHVRIDWLMYAQTPYAKKKILKYLEHKYEGDNPRFESGAKISDTLFNNVFSEIHSNPAMLKLVKEDSE